MKRLQRLLVTLFVGVICPTTAIAQGRGAITGQVTGQGGTPLSGARVTVTGTTLRGVTGENGTYRINNVPVGTQSVTAQMLGYAPRSQQVTVTDAGTATASFSLIQAPLQITGVVVTATGREQNTREIGSSVGLVNTADVPLAAAPTASDLLAGKVTGVVVTQSSGTTGGGARVRIRGSNSMSLSNNPLIVIDGIRVENSESSLTTTVGGQSPSRFNDLNPDDIESIEVLKGPAAAALYGTAAANGVIQVTTKRGQAGKATVRAFTEAGTLRQPASFPDNVLALDARGNPCPIFVQATGGCTVAQTFRSNPLQDPATTPFQKGNREAVGASVSGGSDAATYYVSSTYNQEQGVLPQNNLHRIQVQANSTGRIGDQLNVGANVSYMNNRMELPLSDNALFGILGMGLYGYPDPATMAASQGYANDPAFYYDWKTYQNYSRITGALRGEYRPLSWLSFNGNAGLDRYAREERNRIPRTSAYSPFGSVYTHGYIDNFTFDINDLTTNGAATAIFDLPRSVVSTTSVGSQYIREILHRVEAFGAGLIPGVEESLAGATSDYFAGETNTLNGTLSGYLQQQFAWRDRVFLNAAIRTDKNTAFGRNIGWITYPSFSGSWIISDEDFFPRINALNSLRLRAAYGKAGLRPGPTDALLAFTPLTTTFQRNDVGAFTFGTNGSNTALGSLGNANLKPEKSSELELGFEAQTFNNRLNVEFTYFNKTSRDALVSVPLAPSVGSGTSQFMNVGRVDNKGVEFRLSGTPLRTTTWEWNASLGGSVINNKLVTLGTTAAGTPLAPVVLGLISTQRHVEGYPLGGYWQRPIISYADANGDGLLSPSEVKVDTARAYLGSPFPRRQLTFNTDLHFHDWVRISALVDYNGGQKLLNFTKAFRCNANDTFNCAQLYDPTTPLDQQAAMVAIATANTYAGFVEDASFAKLREVALTINLPQTVATRMRTQGLSLTFAGRNLHTWTKYSGLDPEVNFNGQSLFSTGDAATLPANRLFQVRLDANF